MEDNRHAKRTPLDRIVASWLVRMTDVAKRSIDEVPALLCKSVGRKVEAIKSDGDPTLAAELYVERIAESCVRDASEPVALFGEEQGYIIAPEQPRYLMLIDPIDGAYMALRGLPGACIALCLFEINGMTPVAAVVGDYNCGDLYTATAGEALRNGKPIRVASTQSMTDAFVSTCYGKAYRFERMLMGDGLVRGAGWLETTGSMLSLARVGSGEVDAYFDLMKGYKPYDFAAGAFIAQVAGAIVTDEIGKPIRYPRDQNARCKFIAAATPELHAEILRSTMQKTQPR